MGRPKIAITDLDELARVDALDAVAAAQTLKRRHLRPAAPEVVPTDLLGRDRGGRLSRPEEADIAATRAYIPPLDGREGGRGGLVARRRARDAEGRLLREDRKRRHVSTDVLDHNPDDDRESLMRLTTREHTRAGVAMDERFARHLNREFLRTRRIEEEGPLDVETARALLRQMHPEYAEVVDLVTFGGHRQQEAARKLHVSQPTVSRRLTRGEALLVKWTRMGVEALEVAQYA